jgi:exopolysaccharide production protein ExoQ
MGSANGLSEEHKVMAPAATGLPFVVGFFFSFRLFIMLLAVRVLGTEVETGVEIDLAVNFLLPLLVAFQVLGARNTATPRILNLPSIRWVLLYLGFSCCSLLWSETASLPAAAAYWGAMAADVAMVVLLARSESLSAVANSLMQGYVVGACAVAAIAWLMPAQSDLRLGDEELLGANQIGYLCAFAVFIAQYLMRSKAGKWGFAAALLAVTLLRSLSKTSIIAFLAAEAFLLLRDRSMALRTKLLLTSAAAVVVVGFSGLLTSYFDVYSGAGNSPETLTGRLGIWAFIFDEAIQRPWFGHGFHSVWKVIPPFGEFEARHAHNELLQQFYAYGLAGIVMMIGLYGAFYRQARRLPIGPMRTLYQALLLFILIRGMADTEVFDFSLPLWVIVMLSLLAEQLRETADGANRKVMPEQLRLTSAQPAFNPRTLHNGGIR